MHAVVSGLAGLPPYAIYLLATLLVTAETATLIGLVLPGEATLLLVGFLCFRGQAQLAVAMPLLVAAGLAGDSLAYRAGRRAGPRIRTSRIGQRIDEHRWERAERLILRHGGQAVFLARFIAFARTLAPRLVGVSQMRYRDFLLWDLCGVSSCVCGTLAVGYVAGRSYETVTARFGRATTTVSILTVSVVVLVLIGRYLGRNPDPVAAIARRVARWPPVREVARAHQAWFNDVAARLGTGGAIAVHLVGGVLLLLLVAYGVAWMVGALISSSGLPLVDQAIMRWVSTQRTSAMIDNARHLLSLAQGQPLVILVGLVALAVNWRSRLWHADLIGALDTVCAFVPLVVIAAVSRWAPATSQLLDRLFSTQVVVVTASMGMLAWLLSRRFRWVVGVSAWMVALGGSLLVGASRVYLGWSWPSQSVASILLGSLWVLVFAVAWRARDQLISGNST